ncbi:MAG: hypothetical protein F6K40_12355 [Okeania sp. SIO3I5]|uniref:hypothetical protein n=1 Tax=Okeania sp. SIO3I5 TaxID=2607805 RepID=UPI0013B66D41|nr:hypothetical protein [Okeania sp. SIO3I5]NEQ37022.1 hypothetical protein [Okeania sp. SIO3I5]
MDLQDIENVNSRSFSQNKQPEPTNTNQSQQATQKHQKPKPKNRTSAINKLQETTNGRADIIVKAKKASQIKTVTAGYESGLEEAQLYDSGRNQGFVDGLIMSEIRRVDSIQEELQNINQEALDLDVSAITGAFDPVSKLLETKPAIDVKKYQQKFSLLPYSEES